MAELSGFVPVSQNNSKLYDDSTCRCSGRCTKRVVIILLLLLLLGTAVQMIRLTNVAATIVRSRHSMATDADDPIWSSQTSQLEPSPRSPQPEPRVEQSPPSPPPPIEPMWVMNRLRTGGRIHVVAAGLSRSGSTWQFNCLRILLEHATQAAGLSPQLVHSAHGHSLSELEGCLEKQICVVKCHEFMPQVLHRADAIFVTHRDLRDVLLSSVKKIDACLLYGKQPVAMAFASYANWLPHACYDMRYEDLMADDSSTEIQVLALAARLGVALGENTVKISDVLHQLNAVTHRSKPSEKQQQKTGLMPGHITKDSSAPGAWERLGKRIANLSKRCNLLSEMALIDLGFSGWLRKEGYTVRYRADKGLMASSGPHGARAGGLGMRPTEAAALTEGIFDAFREEANMFVNVLPEAAWLMATSALAAPRLHTSVCPLRTHWDDEIRASRIMEYSLPITNRRVPDAQPKGKGSHKPMDEASDRQEQLQSQQSQPQRQQPPPRQQQQRRKWQPQIRNGRKSVHEWKSSSSPRVIRG
mmetsp:Transcript_3884/g.6460  ORF Transcript_3884/g.6460 Transcript_3884/m.6460 type:complete len:529 (-) Transcript_3884:339-1925(-)